MLSILIGAALVLPPPVPEPQHLRRNEYGYVVDTPGDPELMTFEFRAEPTNEYIPLEIGVHRMLDDEPYEIVEMDPAAGRVVLRTSSWGGFRIADTADLIIHEVSPDIDQIERACFNVMAHLTRDRELSLNDQVWGDAPCPPARSLRGGETLIIVGWNAAGEQLWVTSADDPRDVEWENYDPENRARHRLHDPDAPVWAVMRIPVTEDLTRLGWFEVTPENTLSVLGVSDWRPVYEATDGGE